MGEGFEEEMTPSFLKGQGGILEEAGGHTARGTCAP